MLSGDGGMGELGRNGRELLLLVVPGWSKCPPSVAVKELTQQSQEARDGRTEWKGMGEVEESLRTREREKRNCWEPGHVTPMTRRDSICYLWSTPLLQLSPPTDILVPC